MIKTTLLSLLTLAPVALWGHGSHDHASKHDTQASIDTEARPLTVVPGWGAGDNNVPTPAVGSTHGGIVVDETGLIYVSSSLGIFVFNDAGELINSYQGDAYTNIHAMVLNVEDGVEYIYGARNNRAEAIKFKTSGEIVLQLTFPVEAQLNGKFKPTAVAVKPNGNILVADGYGTNMIFEYDPSGNYLSHFGGKGVEAADKFKTPHGITIDKRYQPARILVSDREKCRLVHFTLDGEFIGEVITGLRRPCAVSIAKDGSVAIAELQGRVALLNADNELVGVLGDNPDESQWAKYRVPPSDWQQGIFTAPHGLSWDHQGNLYVQDWNIIGRVTKWAK